MLTIRKQKFIKLVARTNNILQSYIDAGYSPKSAMNNAYTLYNNLEVSKAIAIEIDKYCNWSQDEWRQELVKLKDDPAAKVSDKVRIVELYGKHKQYLAGEQTNITIANIDQDTLDAIRNKRLVNKSTVTSPTLLSDTQAQESTGS